MITIVNRKIRDALLWLFIFLQLFGPKIGFVDTAVLSSGIAAVFMVTTSTVSLRMKPRYFLFLAALTIFYVYTLFLGAINSGSDSYTLLRYFRFLASALLLPLVFGYLRNYSAEAIIRIVGSCILVHAAVICVQMLFPDVKAQMGPWVGYEKEMFSFRAFGLVGAFDSAAAYLCIGMLIYASLFYAGARGYRLGAAILFLWVAGIFTGRVFMVAGSGILIGIFLYYFKKGPFTADKLIVSLIFVVGVVNAWMMYGEFLVASLTADMAAYEALELFQGEGGYHINTYGEIAAMSKNFFPGEVTTLVFGGALNPGWTDIGYSKLIYTHGLFWALWMVGIYAILLITAIPSIRQLKTLPSVVTALTFTILVLFNYKMFVFGSRGYTEMFLILVLSSHLSCRNISGRRSSPLAEPTLPTCPRQQ